MSSKTKALLAILGASVFWATAGAASKHLFVYLPPIAAAFFRFFVASIALLPVLFFQKNKVNRNGLVPVFFVSLFAAGNILFFYLGLPYTTANASYLVYTGVPLLIVVLSYLFLKERLSAKQWLGLLLGFIGVLFVILLPALQTDQNILGG